MPSNDSEIGNFIDALLTGLECLAEIETAWSQCEGDRVAQSRKHLLMYQVIENELKEFQSQSGFTAKEIMKKWNASSPPSTN